MRIEEWRDENTQELVDLINLLRTEVGAPATSITEFLDQLHHPDWNPEERLLLAFDGEMLVGYIDCWLGHYECGHLATLSLGVRHESRRRGVGTALLHKISQILPRGCEQMTSAVSLAATELRWFLSERGFDATHTTHQMRAHIMTSEPPSLPDGLRWRAFDPIHDQEAFRALHNQIFSNTFRWRPITPTAMEHYLSKRYFQPADIRILEDAHLGTQIGFYWADVDEEEWSHRGMRVGYIESFGVVPNRRGEGIGRLLLATAKAALKNRGCYEAELSVSANNENALKLYEAEDFTITLSNVWMSASRERCFRRVEALRPAYGEMQVALESAYDRFLEHRGAGRATLPAPLLDQFRDWLAFAASGEVKAVLQATGMTLADFTALRNIVPDLEPALSFLWANGNIRRNAGVFYREALQGPRYEPDETFGQCFDEPESALLRAQLVARWVALPAVRVLVLGDTDCVGPILAYLGCRRMHSLDIDDRILSYSQQAAEVNGLDVSIHRHDLRTPLPTYLTGRFDVVTADPPCTVAAILDFARAGAAALHDRPGGLFILALTPAWLGLDRLKELQLSLLGLNFVFLEQRPAVLESRIYPSLHAVERSDLILPDLPAVFSDVWVLRRGRAT